MSRQNCILVSVAVSCVLAPQIALAYVGPGTGLSAIGSFFALLMAIVLVVVGFFWLPLKRILKSRQKKSEVPAEEFVPDDMLVRTTEHIESHEDSSKN